MPEYVEIQIRGHLDPRWAERFFGLQLTHLPGEQTLLAGDLYDQAALHAVLELIRDLNIPLVSVTCGPRPAPASPPEHKAP